MILINQRFLEMSELIIENKQQAASVLKKHDIDKFHPEFIKLQKEIKRVFKANQNYLGLMTKYRFDQKVGIQEIIDLLPWLRDNGSRLPNNPLTYKKFVDLKNDIIKSDNLQRVKTIYNLLPREQKDFIEETDEEFIRLSIEIHKLGILRKFSKKLSAKKTRDDLIKYMKDFYEAQANTLNFNQVLNILIKNKDASKIIVQNPEEGLLVAQIKTFDLSSRIGSPSWCITNHKSHWNDYTNGAAKQFFYWDFDLEPEHELFQIGFTTDEDGSISHIHDRYDNGLVDDIPSKVSNLLVKIDFSPDMDKYRQETLSDISQYNNSSISIVYDNGYQLIVKLHDSNIFNRLKSKKWDWRYNAWRDPELRNYYIYIDFSKDVNDNEHKFGIESSWNSSGIIDGGEEITIRIIGNNQGTCAEFKLVDKKFNLINDDGKDPELNLIDKNFLEKNWKQNWFIPKDVYSIYATRWVRFFQEIKPFLEGADISDYPTRDGKSKFLKAIDSYLIFKIENSNDIRQFTPFPVDLPMFYNIREFNTYVIINKDLNINDENFINIITLSFNIHFTKLYLQIYDEQRFEAVSNVANFGETVMKFIEDGDISTISRYDFNKKKALEKKSYLDKAEIRYEQNEVLLNLGKILWNYLIDGEIDRDVYIEYDKDDNEIGDTENLWKTVILPEGEFYDLKSFMIFDELSSVRGYGFDAWAIGNEQEANSAAYQYYEGQIDENLSNYDNGFITRFLEKDDIADYLAGDIDDHIERIVDSPYEYDIPRIMKDRDEYEAKLEELSELNSKLEELIENRDEAEEELKNLPIDSQEESSELEQKVDDYNSEIAVVESDIDDTENTINYMEDEDDEDYWEWDESEIRSRAESYMDDEMEEIRRDPIDYTIDNYGRDWEFILEHLDKDSMIKELISSYGRGDISSYDGKEHEWTYNDETYYIYKTN